MRNSLLLLASILSFSPAWAEDPASPAASEGGADGASEPVTLPPSTTPVPASAAAPLADLQATLAQLPQLPVFSRSAISLEVVKVPRARRCTPMGTTSF